MQRLTLVYSSQVQEVVSIAIRDSIGQSVYNEDVEMEDGMNLMQIQDVKDFIPGLYTLELLRANQSFYKQILIKN